MNNPTMIRNWTDVKMAAVLAAPRMLKEGRMLNGVYGPPRGGCCLAVLFSHILGIEYLDSPREGCLIVDDIADTGDTLGQYADIPGVTFYTDVAKETSKIIPHYFGIFIPKDSPFNDNWVTFPWEASSCVK